jgi:hypothetical protein
MTRLGPDLILVVNEGSAGKIFDSAWALMGLAVSVKRALRELLKL